MQDFIKLIVRFTAITIIEACSLLLTAWIVPGIDLRPGGSVGYLTAAISVAIVLAVLNGLVRPLVLLLTLPLSIMSIGFFTLIINTGILWLTAYFLPFFQVSGFGSAFWGMVVIAAVNIVLTGLISINDDYNFYEGVVQWLSRRRATVDDQPHTRGLIMLEIDGLSFERAQQALNRGLVPTMAHLQQQGSHRLSPFDCGLPSQTSACQAGIMYGQNDDIPAFRWYDKEQGRLYVSNHLADAAEINQRHSTGRGLLRQGTSINNLIAGDAENALLTMSTLSREADLRRQATEDLYLVFVNPYFFSRTLLLTFWDVIVELYQGLRQRVRDVQPRINRLEKGYPLLRAVTNVFLRDLSTYTVILNIMRGSPAIYTTFVGYDEIAHHAGPDTDDAMNCLKGFDRQLKRILEVIDRKAPRPYDLFILSDHGQSMGATFRQRYGQTLAELVESLISGDGKVTQAHTSSAEARGQAGALLAEIANLQQTHHVHGVKGRALKQATRHLGPYVDHHNGHVSLDTDALVCASGNLAHIYFPIHTDKITMPELEAAHPGLLAALVDHPGIGLVVAYQADGEPWVLGKQGARRLRDGEQTNANPLQPYGELTLRAAQLLRLADFPHAGDLIVISTLYEGNEVAAFEELVGSHGGVGGQQTEAFLFHPADMNVESTANAIDIFPLLNARRDLPVAPQPAQAAASKPQPWQPEVLLTGLRRPQQLISRLAHVFQLDQNVFAQVANDPYAMGQALLIMLVVAVGSGIGASLDPQIAGTPVFKFFSYAAGRIIGWLLMTVLAVVAGNFVRGQGEFSRALRTLAFARAPEALSWFTFLPGIGALLAIASPLMVLLASWLALQKALHISRWRALLVPVISLPIIIIALAATGVIWNGLELTIETVSSQLGMEPANWFGP